MKKLIILGLFLTVFVVSGVFADTLTAGYKLLIKNDAQVVAMEESGRASIKGLSAFDLNPAGLNGIKGKAISLSYTKYFAEMNLFNFKFGIKMPKFGALALSVDYFLTPDLPLMNDTAVYATAKFQDYLVGVGYAYKIYKRMVILGLKGRYLISKVYTFKSSAYSVDGGLNLNFVQSLPIALTVENFGQGKFDGTTFKLPTSANVALSYIADFQNNNIILNFDASSYLEKIDPKYSVSASYEYAKFLKVMFGYKLNTGEKAVGIGVNKFGFIADVNYSFQDVGSVYTLTLKYQL